MILVGIDPQGSPGPDKCYRPPIKYKKLKEKSRTGQHLFFAMVVHCDCKDFRNNLLNLIEMTFFSFPDILLAEDSMRAKGYEECAISMAQSENSVRGIAESLSDMADSLHIPVDLLLGMLPAFVQK